MVASAIRERLRHRMVGNGWFLVRQRMGMAGATGLSSSLLAFSIMSS